MNNKGEILFQKRANKVNSNPSKWGRTGGHVDSGETVEHAMIRELKEEIGIDVKEEELELMSISKDDVKKSFGYDFFLNTRHSVKDYTIQQEEVEDIAYFTIEEIEKNVNNENFVFSSWDKEFFEEQIKKLKEKRREMIF